MVKRLAKRLADLHPPHEAALLRRAAAVAASARKARRSGVERSLARVRAVGGAVQEVVAEALVEEADDIVAAECMSAKTCRYLLTKAQK